MTVPQWMLKRGATIVRRDLHVQFGGRKQGGVGPSRQSPNVFLFSDEHVGRIHGYVDQWMMDGCYHYTGEGQRGDQQMKSGNASILHHKVDGRALRLFEGVGGAVKYIGEFEVDDQDPFYTTDAPETGPPPQPTRSVIVFRLRPLGFSSPLPQSQLSVLDKEQVDGVEIESSNSERFFVEPSREPYEAERREARLVSEFCNYLKQRGLKPTRLRIKPEGEIKPLFCDVYVQSTGLLVEAKGTVERGAVRMALGQLLDYSRFAVVASRALLLPSRPRPDLLALLRSADVGLYYRVDKENFEYLAP